MKKLLFLFGIVSMLFFSLAATQIKAEPPDKVIGVELTVQYNSDYTLFVNVSPPLFFVKTEFLTFRTPTLDFMEFSLQRLPLLSDYGNYSKAYISSNSLQFKKPSSILSFVASHNIYKGLYSHWNRELKV